MSKLLHKPILLLLGFNIIAFVAFSQDMAKVDSLSKLIKSASVDSVKVNLLQKLFWEYRRTNTEKAMEFAEQSLQLAESISYLSGIATATYQIGIIKKVQNNYVEATQLLQNAILYFQKAQDTLGIIGCYNDLGDIYNRQNNYEKALDYLEEARKLVVAVGNKEKLSRIYSLLAGIYNSQKQYEKALEYHQKSLEMNLELGFKLGMSVNYNNIGNVYLDMKQFARAKENYLKSLELKSEINDVVGIASSYNNLGLVSAGQKNLTEAIDYHNRALAKYVEMDDKTGIAMCFVNLANDHLQAGKPAKAVEFADKGIEITKLYNLKRTQTEAFLILSEAYAQLRHFEKAYDYQKLYKIYSDSLQNQDVVGQITKMESKFEIEKKEKEIALLNAEKEKQELKIETQKLQRNMMIGFTALVLVVLIFLYWGYRNKKKLNTTLNDLNLTKSRFFANISHEFRTPLTLLLGPLEKLMSSAKKEDRDMIGMMHRNATRLLFLDNQLLEISKLESGKMKLEVTNSDITQALKGMVMSFQSLAEKRNIEFIFRFPDNSIQAFFDQDKLEKIVYNLLSNAFKFTPEKGTVNFELSIILNEAKQLLPQKIKKINGKVICITVHDTGPGIAKENLNKIFDRFYQVDTKLNRNFEGTGLGLALSKELAELHHGILQVESESEKGSVFTVFLPIDKNSYSPDEIVEHRNEPIVSYNSGLLESGSDVLPIKGMIPTEEFPDHKNEDKVQILIIEDNPDMRSYIRDCFNDHYEISEAGNGKTGLDMATNTIPDIIVSDLMMPEMDGLELCKRIKTDERTSHIPVILLTALASVEDRIRGLETGADDYLAKPFNRQELQTRTQNLVEQRKKLIERFSKSVRLEPKDIAITSVDEKFIEKLISKIEKNMADPDLNVDYLIEEIHLSRSQLHRKLKALTGQSATEFIRFIRLKRAAQLLEQHHGTIAETVYAVGFNNLSYFSKCFQKQFGVTPKDYKEQGRI